MNSLLIKHKPIDATVDEFVKIWNNSSYALSALDRLLEEQEQNNKKVSKEDFDCPNHYAKLAFEAGENKAYAFIRSLLPTSKG